jgi:hypothetical protein
MGNGQAGDGELDAVDGGGGHRVRCGLLWNSTGSGADGQPAPTRSDACHGGGKAITLADRGGHDEPEVALAAVAAGGIQGACLLHVNHEGVNGALVAAGVHAHGANQVAAGHRAVVDQAGADRGADDGGEHRMRCGLLWNSTGSGGTRQGAPWGSPEQVSDCFQALLAGCQFLQDGPLLLGGGVSFPQPLLQLEGGQVVEGGGDGSVQHGVWCGVLWNSTGSAVGGQPSRGTTSSA